MSVKRFAVLSVALAMLAGSTGTGAGAQELGPIETGVTEAPIGKTGVRQILNDMKCFPAGCDTDSESGSVPDDGVTLSASDSGWSVTCSGTNDNAHYSRNAGGAIFKTRITCTGYGVSQVFIHYQGGLKLDWAVNCSTSNIAWVERAAAKYGQWVEVNGDVKTFYTPQSGNGGRGTDWWGMSSTFYFIHDGLISSVGSHHNYVCDTI